MAVLLSSPGLLGVPSVPTYTLTMIVTSGFMIMIVMKIMPHGDENEERDPEEGVGPRAVIVEVLHRQLGLVQRPNLTTYLIIMLILAFNVCCTCYQLSGY